MSFGPFLICVAMVAVNLVLYLGNTDNWWNLLSAVGCGLCAFGCIGLR